MTTPLEWTSRSDAPELPDNEIHVWRAPLVVAPGELAVLGQVLSSHEKARAERFVFDKDRERFIVAHGTLRRLLGAYLRCAPESICFTYGANGKPSVSTGDPAAGIRFNLSHSGELMLIGISRDREIGIDIEKVRAERAGEEVARRFFSTQEVEELRRLPAELRTEGFFLCWTRKEAYVKALGEGLRFPLDQFRVSLTPGGAAELNSGDQGRWALRSLSPQPGYAGAVVGEGQDWLLRQFQREAK
jgi:4'-phosphopantetheinyl transferase